jgi:hypothetical protein
MMIRNQAIYKTAAAGLGVFSLGIVLLGAGAMLQGQNNKSAASDKPPVYKVDPFWPKPLPNKWAMQQIVDISIDKDDHIWMINRDEPRPDELGAATNPPRTDCCVVGPEIIEFAQDGTVLKSWGHKGWVAGWPQHLQSMIVDREGNVWISGTEPGDSIQKFDSNGKLLWDFGHRWPKGKEVKQDNQQTELLMGVEDFELDQDAKEIYVADGARNKRVLVFDMNTGAFKRGWGGHGLPLSEIDNNPTPPYDISGPPPDVKQFVQVIHTIHLSKDGLLYLGERGADRVSVYKKDGTFVMSFFVHPSTQARGPNCGGPFGTTAGPCGTTFNMSFSADPEQKYLFVADGTNNMVWIFNRKTGEPAGQFGGHGRYAGQLHWIDTVATDSKGNVYTGEVEDGKRIQKFVLAN